MRLTPAVAALALALFPAGAGAASGAPQPATTPTASAACTALLVDTANILNVGLESDVLDATKQVQADAADIRVHTVPGTVQLDAWRDSTLAACPSWRGSDGSMKNNLIVLAVAPESRQTGLYYGGQWADELRDAWPGIQADAMNPRFADGDMAGGLVGGLDGLHETIDDAASEGDSSLVGWWTLWALLGAAGAGLLGWFGLRTAAGRRRDRAELEEARADYERWKARAQGAFLALDRAVGPAEATSKTAHDGRWAADGLILRGKADRVLSAYVSMDEVPAPALNADAYRRATREWRDVAERLERTQGTAEELQQLVSRTPAEVATHDRATAERARRRAEADRQAAKQARRPKPAPRRPSSSGGSGRSGSSSSTTVFGGFYGGGGSSGSDSSGGSSYGGGGSSSYDSGSSDGGGSSTY